MNNEQSRASYLNRDTLLPLGLVVSVLGGAVGFGMLLQTINNLTGEMGKQISRTDRLEQRVMVVENRQGVTETQFNQVQQTITELKTEFRDFALEVKAALRIK